MKISKIKIKEFRRFSDLTIENISHSAKLVVLAGPNGSGKSSLFDAFLLKYRRASSLGWSTDFSYFNRSTESQHVPADAINIEMHDGKILTKGSVYIRSAYRNDPEFLISSLTRNGPILDNFTLNKLIETDATVSANYNRLASQAMEDILVNEDPNQTVGRYRENLIGAINEPLNRLFPDLNLIGLGNPMVRGTFQFSKGAIKIFDYQNLSGGEKAVFDLLLDLVVKRRSYTDCIFCIDEPETHLNTKIQGALLQELLNLIPENSQLWIASHSIGMMRKAREIYSEDQESVAFLNFGGRNFDTPTTITPQQPNRDFWQGVMQVALDDLSALVSPREVVICEGDPLKKNPGKNVEHDARIYSIIFSEKFPDVTFISAGSSNQISGDFLGLATALPKIASGMKVRRLIDLDDNSSTDVDDHKKNGITVLSRRHIESYLYDDEILKKLCNSLDKPECIDLVLAAKKEALSQSLTRGNQSDDIKSAAGKIYTEVKRILDITQRGRDMHSFARDVLAPLINHDTAVYEILKHDIFES